MKIVKPCTIAEARKLLRELGDDAFGPPDAPTAAAVEEITDLARLEELAHHVKPQGAIWVVRPGHKLVKSVKAHGEAAGLTGGPTVTLSDEYVGDRLDLGDGVGDGAGDGNGER